MSGSPAPLAIREARPGDCPRLAEIYNQAIRSGRSTMDSHPVSAEWFRDQLARLGAREAVLVGATPQGVIGYGVVKRYSDRAGYAPACETSVYLADEATGRGHGAALLEAVVERARRTGHHHLVARIMAANEGSVRFHRRHGFELVGRQREIGRLGGAWHDVVILQRVFPEVSPESDPA